MRLGSQPLRFRRCWTSDRTTSTSPVTGKRRRRRSAATPADGMARIRSDLLQAIADKLGATTTRPAYTRIERAVHDTFLERDLAALVVASKLKININKYSTSAQR